jgi:hypothetical protein
VGRNTRFRGHKFVQEGAEEVLKLKLKLELELELELDLLPFVKLVFVFGVLNC